MGIGTIYGSCDTEYRWKWKMFGWQWVTIVLFKIFIEEKRGNKGVAERDTILRYVSS
jgi:hypothetical protein